MKSNSKFLTLAFGGFVAAAVAGDARAQTYSVNSPVGNFSASTTTPWTTYTYNSPKLSVYTGVQFGNNQNTVVNQNSTRNISGVAQVGKNLNASVTQQGSANFTSIVQFGRTNNALGYQFGR